MLILDKLVRRSHQVYLCRTSGTVCEGGANKVPVPVRHTRRLHVRGRVADQPAHQGTSLDNARNAAPNALRDVLRREVQPGDHTSASSDRTNIGARGVICPGVCGRGGGYSEASASGALSEDGSVAFEYFELEN